MAGYNWTSPKEDLIVVHAVLAARIQVQQHFFFRLSACTAISSAVRTKAWCMVHLPTDVGA
ncbi:hypothetical protein AN456_29010 [Pseudomonas aeruginosa]|nr:hypothetical protein AN455_29155 [Pseudomonas aeruginosa]KRV12351.1 hypothetical protein AN456_29010 [Pseudomonas aeruginosa]